MTDRDPQLRGHQYEVWVATIDAATCIVCMGLHGQIFPANDGPWPPMHPRCRCHRRPLPDSVSKSPKKRGEESADATVPPRVPKGRGRYHRRRRQGEDDEQTILELEEELKHPLMPISERRDAIRRINEWRKKHP